MKYTKVLAVIMVVLIAVTGLYALIRVGYARADESVRPQESNTNLTNDNNSLPLTPQEKLSSLTQKATELTSKPGWIYSRETVSGDTDRENGGVLPNGNDIPISYVLESWDHVNDDGFVFEGLSTMFSLDGEITQVSIFKDNNYWNSATGQYTPQAPYMLGALSGDFTSLVTDYSSKPRHLPDVSSTEINGKSVSVFTIYDNQVGKLEISDFKQPVIAVKIIAWFDEETGLMIHRKQIMTLADGTERTLYDTFTDVRVGSEPPADVIVQIEKQGGK